MDKVISITISNKFCSDNRTLCILALPIEFP